MHLLFCTLEDKGISVHIHSLAPISYVTLKSNKHVLWVAFQKATWFFSSTPSLNLLCWENYFSSWVNSIWWQDFWTLLGVKTESQNNYSNVLSKVMVKSFLWIQSFSFSPIDGKWKHNHCLLSFQSSLFGLVGVPAPVPQARALFSGPSVIGAQEAAEEKIVTKFLLVWFFWD